MRLVVDTNIIFSAILSSDGLVHDLFINSGETFEFFSPTFVYEELKNNRSKLLKISNYSEEELDYLQYTIFKRIELIDSNSLTNSEFQRAFELTKDIDENDTPFIALALALDSPVWTGDKKLKEGLSEKGVDWVLNTKDIRDLLNRL